MDAGPDRWVVIDPLPRAGGPEVEVLAALRNRCGDLVETGDVERAMRRRFDRLPGMAGLDRERATAPRAAPTGAHNGRGVPMCAPPRPAQLPLERISVRGSGGLSLATGA